MISVIDDGSITLPARSKSRLTSRRKTTQLIPLPVIQFANPQASIVYDVDSTQTAGSRKRLLDIVATGRIPMAGVHCGTL